MKNVPTNLSNLKSKLDKLDIDKLVPVSVDLSKLMMLLKKMYIMLRLKLLKTKQKREIPGITKLATSTALNAKINEVKNKIPNITNLTSTTALIAVENKIPNVSNLVEKLTITQKLGKLKIKLLLTMIMISTLVIKNLII